MHIRACFQERYDEARLRQRRYRLFTHVRRAFTSPHFWRRERAKMRRSDAIDYLYLQRGHASARLHAADIRLCLSMLTYADKYHFIRSDAVP